MPSLDAATRATIWALWIAQTDGVRDNTVADIATATGESEDDVHDAIVFVRLGRVRRQLL